MAEHANPFRQPLRFSTTILILSSNLANRADSDEKFADMENTLIDGRYLLLAEIGRGGEARVFRARDQSTDRVVAVRVALRPITQTVPNHPSFFHDSWVQLLASGLDPHYGAYQILELLEGQTLRELIRPSPLNPQAWCAFVDQSLAAVKALHLANWIHGDLNADNFIDTASGWKLLELPFLKFDPPTARSTMFGSINTVAPEQFDGKPPDVRSDIYSLGCLYYYAASGVFPHPGKNSAEVAISCLRFAPVSLRDQAPALPTPWSDWVMKLIATKPGDRPASIAAARQLLEVA